MKTGTMPRLTDVKGITRLLRVSPSTIHRWLRVGMPRLQATRGGKLLFDADQITSWLATPSDHVRSKIQKIERLNNGV